MGALLHTAGRSVNWVWFVILRVITSGRLRLKAGRRPSADEIHVTSGDVYLSMIGLLTFMLLIRRSGWRILC